MIVGIYVSGVQPVHIGWVPPDARRGQIVVPTRVLQSLFMVIGVVVFLLLWSHVHALHPAARMVHSFVTFCNRTTGSGVSRGQHLNN